MIDFLAALTTTCNYMPALRADQSFEEIIPPDGIVKHRFGEFYFPVFIECTGILYFMKTNYTNMRLPSNVKVCTFILCDR